MHRLAAPFRPWQSLQWRLPLLVALLLVIVVSIISLHTYRSLEALLVREAEAHALLVLGEVELLLAPGLANNAQQAEGLASLPALASFAAGTAEAEERAVEELQAQADARQSTVGIGVLSGDERWEIWVDGPAAGEMSDARQIAVGPATPASGIGPLRASGSSIYFDATAALPSGPEGAERWLVLRQRVTSGEGARVLAGLVGEEAFILVGSDGPGGAWSDLELPVQRPERESDSRFTWTDQVFHGATIEMEDAPWQLWVGTPRARILAPARALARDEVLFGTLILLFGTLGAWFLGRHVSRPISRLTKAADRISAGAYEQLVPVQSEGEVGQLARAFNVMAENVQSANAEMEERVERRTSQLKEALTELHEAQEQLVRRERLAILGQLASGVGHELRNPLGVMTNAVYYLEAISPDARPDVTEYFGIIRTQLGLAEKIIGDLLDFARRREPEREVVRLDSLLDDQLSRLGSRKGVEVERSFADEAPPALVDRVQIGQVVFNLLTNAVQAMTEDGGTLTAQTGCAPDGRPTLTVIDTGTGISPEDLDRVFEPLFTTKARGIGLGLSVSAGFVENNDGTINVESTPGIGTTFTLTLPAA